MNILNLFKANTNVEVYVLMKRKKEFSIIAFNDLKDTKILCDIEQLQKEALIRNSKCSKIVIITKKVWIDIVKLVDSKNMKAELTPPNLEYFEFLNDSNIVYFNVFNSDDSFPNIILNSYQHRLF
jgi:hypothetical protein